MFPVVYFTQWGYYSHPDKRSLNSFRHRICCLSFLWFQSNNAIDLIKISIPTIDIEDLFGYHVGSVVSVGKRNIFGDVKVKSLIVHALIWKMNTSQRDNWQELILDLVSW